MLEGTGWRKQEEDTRDYTVPLRFLNRKDKNVAPDVIGALDQGCNTNGLSDGYRIRRLTPVECERLQGFPDNWTQYGANGEEISDTQRYRCLGNAVIGGLYGC